METLELTSKMLRNNPDFYTLWNFRREILHYLYPDLQSSSPPQLSTSPTSSSIAAKSIVYDKSVIRDGELALSTEGIKRNPKSCEFCMISSISSHNVLCIQCRSSCLTTVVYDVLICLMGITTSIV